MTNKVFVFGSNEAGLHGAGAARVAYKERGAQWGFSYGITGSCFAIPTKDADLITLPLDRIEGYVAGFKSFAAGHRNLIFQVTCIGCGLAGLAHRDIAPMFKGASLNCEFDELWKEFLGPHVGYWGTYPA